MEVLEKDVVEAVFQLDEDYEIISGDERIYQLLGDNTMYAFNKLIHPDDCEAFESYIKSEDSKGPHIARCLVKNNHFRWLLFYKKNTVESNLKKLYEIKIQNVVAIGNKFDEYFMKMRKYRGAINLMKEKLFDYDFNTGVITIYCYINNRSEIIEKDFLPDWKKRMLRLGFVSKDSEEPFEMLCNNIEKGSDSFSLTFETSLMSKGERKDTLNFKGQTIKEGTEKLLVTGIISELGSRMTEGQVLVKSETGIMDSATGVLNKKTVQDEITDIIDKARNSDSKELMYLVIMDIDDFKKVNDTYGHYFGDEVVLEFAQTLKQAIGERGLVGRVGGDEFLALIKDVDSEEDVRLILKAVRKSLAFKLNE
ncbi:MAG: GGDEF domain-containing protein, partial [Eubacteriales bacterium]|nr:GGDEF domain-containing protein [Eubacteriales bacterium]